MSTRAEIEAQIRRDEEFARTLQEEEVGNVFGMGDMLFDRHGGRAARAERPDRAAPPPREDSDDASAEGFSMFFGAVPPRRTGTRSSSGDRFYFRSETRAPPRDRARHEHTSESSRTAEDEPHPFEIMFRMMAEGPIARSDERLASNEGTRARRRSRAEPPPSVEMVSRFAEQMFEGAVGGFGSEAAGGRFFHDPHPHPRPQTHPHHRHTHVHGRATPMAELFGGGMMGTLFRSMFAGEEGAPSTYEQFLDMIERRGNVSRGASDAEISAIPVTSYKDSRAGAPRPASSSAAGRAAGVDDREKCVICLSEFQDDSKVMRLPCTHIFHDECVARWLRVNKTCPSCKSSISPDAHLPNS